MELEFEDRNLKLTVNPAHAAIIWHFQAKRATTLVSCFEKLVQGFNFRILFYIFFTFFLQAEWTLSDLSTALQMPTSVLRRKLAFWIGHGALKETSGDVFTVVEKLPSTAFPGDHVVVVDDDSESAMASEEQRRDEELQVRFEPRY